jgi:lipopolysaccharide exporter
VKFLTRVVNLRGELFSSTFTFGLSAIVKLASSLVMTRLLNPEAYGIFAVLFSILFMIELLSDVGTTGLIIRHERGGEQRFIHTVWTIRLIRGVFNFLLLYALAPVIAAIYQTPVLTDALRTFSFWFLLTGLESMGFTLAQRDQRSRIGNYVEFVTSTVTTGVVIGFATLLHSHFALIYGMLLQRAVTVAISHLLYRNIGVGFAWDRAAARDQFNFARLVLPSSLLTVALSQYDKVIFLKLFDLSLLGVYGLAGNIIGPVGGMVVHNCRVVLYARCAAYFRENRRLAGYRYYHENRRLFYVCALPAAAIGGAAHLIVAVLYDVRYAMAGDVLVVLGLGTMLGTFHNAAEQFLVASGLTRVGLIANVLRLALGVPASLIGYYFYGFPGFIWIGSSAGFLILAYFFYEQRRHGLLDLREEAVRFGWGLAVFAVCYVSSEVLLKVIPPQFLHIHFGRHGVSA